MTPLYFAQHIRGISHCRCTPVLIHVVSLHHFNPHWAASMLVIASLFPTKHHIFYAIICNMPDSPPIVIQGLSTFRMSGLIWRTYLFSNFYIYITSTPTLVLYCYNNLICAWSVIKWPPSLMLEFTNSIKPPYHGIFEYVPSNIAYVHAIEFKVYGPI